MNAVEVLRVRTARFMGLYIMAHLPLVVALEWLVRGSVGILERRHGRSRRLRRLYGIPEQQRRTAPAPVHRDDADRLLHPGCHGGSSVADGHPHVFLCRARDGRRILRLAADRRGNRHCRVAPPDPQFCTAFAGLRRRRCPWSRGVACGDRADRGRRPDRGRSLSDPVFDKRRTDLDRGKPGNRSRSSRKPARAGSPSTGQGRT